MLLGSSEIFPSPMLSFSFPHLPCNKFNILYCFSSSWRKHAVPFPFLCFVFFPSFFSSPVISMLRFDLFSQRGMYTSYCVDLRDWHYYSSSSISLCFSSFSFLLFLIPTLLTYFYLFHSLKGSKWVVMLTVEPYTSTLL